MDIDTQLAMWKVLLVVLAFFPLITILLGSFFSWLMSGDIFPDGRVNLLILVVCLVWAITLPLTSHVVNTNMKKLNSAKSSAEAKMNLSDKYDKLVSLYEKPADRQQSSLDEGKPQDKEKKLDALGRP